MNGNKEVYLFVYGTLMRKNRAGQSYLDNADFKGEGTLDGYSLYDLGDYPGIVEDKDGKVKGELYTVSQDRLSKIDIYEEEGSLYKRARVQVHNEKQVLIDAYVYVYNQPVSEKTKIEFHDQPWTEKAVLLWQNK